MALVACPDCGQTISDVAQACIHCGRPMGEPAEPRHAASRHSFFPVATHKFIVLSLCTLNLYTLYWCYQNWSRIRQDTGENLSPFWRAFFAPLWGFSLFGRISQQARERGMRVAWSSGFLATLYLVVCAIGAAPPPWWLISLAGLVPFLPVVATVRRLTDAEAVTEARNDSYSGGNVATIIVGGLLVLLAIAGTFAPEETFEVQSDSITGWTSVLDSKGGNAIHFLLLI
jgi:hypothetical protein